MKIRLISDIHNEFLLERKIPFVFTPMEGDKEAICVLAGDIGLAEKPSTLRDLLKQASEMFRAVIYVKGNHESYHCSILRSHAKIQDIIKSIETDNVFLMENETIVFDDIAFVCATLWTDFNKGNPLNMYSIQTAMNDFRVIRTGNAGNPYERKFTPSTALQLHFRSKDYIFSQVKLMKEEGKKVVVVSHHGPTWLSSNPYFPPDEITCGYVSDLSNEILDTNPDYWLHGHIHHAHDYMVGDTHVITNPYGYPGEPVNFNETLVVEV